MSDTNAEPGRAEMIRAMIVWTIASAIFGAMALPMFQDRFYLHDDLGNFHIPLRYFYQSCLVEGEPFHWFPKMFCGFDLHGEGQIGMYHPLHLLLYSLLPFKAALAFEFLASYPALFVGTFLLFKRWGLRNDGASVAALSFAFSGSPIFRFMHLNGVAIIAHIPWLLLAADVVLRGAGGRRTAWGCLAVTLLTASQLLLGYPQWVLISLVMEGLFYLYALRRDRHWSRLALLVWAKALGVLLGGIQLIPTWKALSLSVRNSASLDFIGQGSLSPLNFASLILPYIYRARAIAVDNTPAHEFGLYNGTIVVALVLLLAIRGVDSRWRPLARAACILSVLGLLLALGRYTPLIRLLSVVPVVNRFRCPARFLLLYQLGTAALAAIAYFQLANPKDSERPSWRSLRLLGLIPVACLLLLMLAALAKFVRPDVGAIIQISSSRILILSLAGPCIITGLVALAARGVRYALLALVVAAGADQAIFAISYLNRNAPLSIDSMLPVTPAPPHPAGYRIFAGKNSFKGRESVGKFNLNVFTMGGQSLVDGYAGLTPQRLLDYKQQACLRVAGAGWERKDKERGWDAEEEASGGWVSVPDPLTRVRLFAKTVATTDPAADITDLDLDTTAMVSEDLQLKRGLPGIVWTRFDRPGFIGLATDCGTRQLLFLGESFHPGWKTTVDGVDVRTLRVNGDFMGCLVDPGQHEVVFRYDPPGLRTGKLMTGAGLLLALVTLAIGLYRGARWFGSSPTPPHFASD